MLPRLTAVESPVNIHFLNADFMTLLDVRILQAVVGPTFLPFVGCLGNIQQD